MTKIVPGLTIAQEDALLEVMREEGVSEHLANNVVAAAREKMGTPPRSGNVTVTQSMDVVEAGATVVGYQAKHIGRSGANRPKARAVSCGPSAAFCQQACEPDSLA